ncbi:MAG TPA: EfeM/EfeO family lipoprotein [Baekduia sp.]
MTRLLIAVCALGLGGTLLAGCGSGDKAASRDGAGAAAGRVDIRVSQCGGGWTAPRDGRLDLTVTNRYSEVADVYLADPRTGGVYDELEGLAPGASAKIDATLGGGRYQLQCYTGENNPWRGPVVHVVSSAAPAERTPGVVPVTFADLIEPSKAYQKWITSRLPVLLAQVTALRTAVAGGSTAAAETAWVKAHMTYETLGAAYDAFGPLNEKINGAPSGSQTWREDHDLAGFHLIEGLLWSGAPRAQIVPAVTRLQHDVQRLIKQFVTAEIAPADLPLRSHEIIENAIQFELNEATDEGSHTTLATVTANLAGARKALSFVAPLLRTRYPRLGETQQALAAAQTQLAAYGRDGRWTPLRSLSTLRRRQVDASLESLAELLAPVAAIGDIRDTVRAAGL